MYHESETSDLSLSTRSPQAIRRSLKGGDKDTRHAQTLSVSSKSATAIIPPKKVSGVSSMSLRGANRSPLQVIRALYDYTPQNPASQELPFSKGDFLYVISRENDTDWYEACNPQIAAARGLVPVAYFEVIGKTERQSAGSVRSDENQDQHDSGFAESNGNTVAHRRSDSTNTTRAQAHAQTRMSTMGKNAGAMVYGVVKYDFHAERPDELEAERDDPVIIIAQSNPEWFVAKPIGRLGGPGLIPVAWVQLKDMVTGKPVDDPLDAVQRAGVPKVEEWKKMAADYKNSSISLGQLEPQQQQMMDGMGRMSMGQAGSQQSIQSSTSQVSTLVAPVTRRLTFQQTNSQRGTRQPTRASQQHQPLLAPMSASLPRYCFDNDMYWYIIECQMEDGKHWELSRYYADFYDFQIALLETFPEEAGNRGKVRTLPFMPGPVAHVTDAISNGRRQNLDDYIKKILSMPPHISKCGLVRQLFAPRPGDFEIDPNALGEDYRLSGTSQQSTQDPTIRQSLGGPPHRAMAPPTAHISPTQASHQRGPSQPSSNIMSSAPNGQSYLQPMNHQPSSISQTSAASSGGPNPNPGGAIKIKVFFQEDIIAIRVPQDIGYQALKDKLRDRLKVNEDIVVQYKDEPSSCFADLTSDADLDTAIQRNPRLQLHVNYANS